ncbi:hypothetical protein H4R33_003610 [Dimargaris cristalligena]|nr:hypothetical protein H4R33_003610 [Dimargaris cristalligena]
MLPKLLLSQPDEVLELTAAYLSPADLIALSSAQSQLRSHFLPYAFRRTHCTTSHAVPILEEKPWMSLVPPPTLSLRSSTRRLATRIRLGPLVRHLTLHLDHLQYGTAPPIESLLDQGLQSGSTDDHLSWFPNVTQLLVTEADPLRVRSIPNTSVTPTTTPHSTPDFTTATALTTSSSPKGATSAGRTQSLPPPPPASLSAPPLSLPLPLSLLEPLPASTQGCLDHNLLSPWRPLVPHNMAVNLTHLTLQLTDLESPHHHPQEETRSPQHGSCTQRQGQLYRLLVTTNRLTHLKLSCSRRSPPDHPVPSTPAVTTVTPPFLSAPRSPAWHAGFVGCPRLRVVTVDGCADDPLLRSIHTHLSSLRSLTLRRHRITGRALAEYLLPTQPLLRSLTLDPLPPSLLQSPRMADPFAPSATRGGFFNEHYLPQLRHLTLTWAVSDLVIDHDRHLPLHQPVLHYRSHSGGTLLQFKRLWRSLKSVCIRRLPVGDVDIHRLVRNCPRLAQVELDQVPVTGNGYRALLEHSSRLRTLRIRQADALSGQGTLTAPHKTVTRHQLVPVRLASSRIAELEILIAGFRMDWLAHLKPQLQHVHTVTLPGPLRKSELLQAVLICPGAKVSLRKEQAVSNPTVVMV